LFLDYQLSFNKRIKNKIILAEITKKHENVKKKKEKLDPIYLVFTKFFEELKK